MELIQVLQNIDWLFAAILLIGGRYWGAKYFTLFKKTDYNFLAFATLFGALWIGIQHFTGKIGQDEAGSIFITYLFITSFYQILAKRLFEWVENKFGKHEE